MDFSDLQAYQDGLNAIGIAGSDLCVYAGGKTVYRHLTGDMNREAGLPMRKDTIHQMYSMTKPFTVICAMQLYERGAFLMEEPIANYLPEFEHVRVRVQDEYGAAIVREARNPIRVRHLMTMTAGFNYNFDAPALAALRERNPAFTTREFARAMADEPLDFEPGTHYRYSLCHDVLGALIEVWSGMRFEAYVKKYILEPLGMRDAWFHVPGELRARCAVKYRFHADTGDFEALPYENAHQPSPNAESGGAGLSMTVDEYMKFAVALLHGGVGETGARVIGRETLRMMTLNQLSDDCLRDYRDYPRQGYGYGLGLRTLMDKALAASAGGVGEFGWGGAAGTYLMVDPVRDVCCVFAEQSMPSHNAITHRRIRNLIYRALED